MKYIITGAAGFIGFHLAKKLLSEGNKVIGIDNVNDYYSVKLKQDRLKALESKNFAFCRVDISDTIAINEIFKNHSDTNYLIHLAAQAGVRYSLENPLAYANSNLLGQVVIFDAAYKNLKNIPQIIYASSSSVYGNQEKTPFSVDDRVDKPVSLYAATKKSCELIAESFAATHNINSTGLRFFTVYGEYGRPDMAYFSFTENILAGKTIKLFNNGNLKRDFTYVDDIISGILAATHRTKKNEKHEVFNLGNHKPVELKYFVETLEDLLGKKAVIEYLPMQKGDVYQTYADISLSEMELGFKPKTSIEQGLAKFVEWYRAYFRER